MTTVGITALSRRYAPWPTCQEPLTMCAPVCSLWCPEFPLGAAFTFLITAGLQAAGLSLFLLIRHVVPTEKKLDKADSKAGSKKVTASPGAPEEALPSEREDAPLLVNE